MEVTGGICQLNRRDHNADYGTGIVTPGPKSASPAVMGAALDRGRCAKVAKRHAGENVGVARNQWLAWYVANDMNLNNELTLSLMEALWAESKFHNYANAKVPSSVHIANDGIAVDHNSVGVLQQQVNGDGSSRGWGDVRSAMNPEAAMRVFATRAQGAKHRGKGADKVAQEVQRSAFTRGDNYRAKQGDAQALIDRMKAGCS